MKDLRKRFERFCLKNRHKGIPNLMLILAIGNLITYFLSSIDPSNVVYSWLCFNGPAILRGQVWRLVSYVFTYLIDTTGTSFLLAALSLFCYYQFGKILEQHWGTFRFNLYYLIGILLTDLAALLLGYPATASALNLSLFLAIATIAPEARVLLFFVIPIKMKYMAWVYLGITAYSVLQYLQAFGLFSFLWVLPIIPLANYFLFFGSDLQNLLPNTWRYKKSHKKQHTSYERPNANWARSYQSKSGERPYRHKCTVCGKTDVQYPNLEFRYCSKCDGYYCYCIDHINEHQHIHS